MKKFYFCDRGKCERCHPECRHTTDRSHALHPEVPEDRFDRILTFGHPFGEAPADGAAVSFELWEREPPERGP